MRIKELQKEVYQNKLNKKFNVSDIGKETTLMTEEKGEYVIYNYI